MPQNVFVRDLNLGILAPTDGRSLEICVDGLPLYHGAQLAVDATLVCALRRDGSAKPGAASIPGVALVAARRRKARVYPEFAGPHARCRLVVWGLEVGGRWSVEAWDFLRHLARARTRAEEPRLRRAAEVSWRRRWIGLVSCAAGRAVAESLLGLAGAPGVDGNSPSTAAVLEDARYVRMPQA